MRGDRRCETLPESETDKSAHKGAIKTTISRGGGILLAPPAIRKTIASVRTNLAVAKNRIFAAYGNIGRAVRYKAFSYNDTNVNNVGGRGGGVVSAADAAFIVVAHKYFFVQSLYLQDLR